jgi:putative NADH-flavin reductase
LFNLKTDRKIVIVAQELDSEALIVSLSFKGHGSGGRIEKMKLLIFGSTQSRLNWRIVRPGAFVDGNRTGNYRHGFPGTDKTLKLKIARADVADFILKQLADDSYLHKTPSVSYLALFYFF